MEACIVAVHPLEGVRAGSALLRVDARLLVVQDDAFCAGWIELPDLQHTRFPLAPDSASLPKGEKPDFEAAVRSPDGVIFLLGSGSTPRRTVIARFLPSARSVVLTAMPQVYDCVRRALGLASGPNIEGAVIEGGVLRLFHRGIGHASAMIDLPSGVLDGEPPRVLACHPLELGDIEGVPLSITDAAMVDRHRALFLAVAEDTPDAIIDGPVAGCAIGLLTGPADQRQVRWCRVLDSDGVPSRRKFEGIAADDDLRGAWVITDPDDPDRNAELCRIELCGFEVEHGAARSVR
jgi:hypothetical protein